MKQSFDTLTRSLLAAIALALWVLILRSFFAPTPARAGGDSPVTVSASGDIGWAVKDHRVYAYRATKTGVESIGSAYIP